MSRIIGTKGAQLMNDDFQSPLTHQLTFKANSWLLPQGDTNPTPFLSFGKIQDVVVVVVVTVVVVAPAVAVKLFTETLPLVALLAVIPCANCVWSVEERDSSALANAAGVMLGGVGMVAVTAVALPEELGPGEYCTAIWEAETPEMPFVDSTLTMALATVFWKAVAN
jgi:hypothetical protein